MSYMPGKPLERWLLVVDLPTRKLALANDPAVVETVMLDRNGTFPKSPSLTVLLEPLVGGGVFGQPGGAAVKETRRIYARSLAAIPEERVRDVTRAFVHAYIRRWLSEPGKPVPITEELSRLTVDVVSECTLGGTFEAAQSQRFTRLFFAYQKKTLPLVLMLTKRDPETVRRVVREMGLHAIGTEMRQIMRDRFIAALIGAEPKSTSAPFPSALSEAGRLGASPDARTAGAALDEIAVMLLAGHETTASSLSWLTHQLAGDARLQEDAAAAITSTPAAANSRFPGVAPDDMIDALARETLRLFPPIGFFLRETTSDVEFREKPIPAGSYFVIAPWTLHRHRKFWPQPDDFRPERWLPGEAAPPRTSYMPFGLGARICPGARFAAIEMEEIVRALLTHTRLSPSGGKRPKPLGNLTSRPDREIYLNVALRRPLPESPMNRS